jgi:hypothetical protein
MAFGLCMRLRLHQKERGRGFGGRYGVILNVIEAESGVVGRRRGEVVGVDIDGVYGDGQPILL